MISSARLYLRESGLLSNLRKRAATLRHQRGDRSGAGGWLLAIPNNIFDLILMSIVFFGWVERSDRAQREREAAGELDNLADPEAYSQAQAEDRSGI